MRHVSFEMQFRTAQRLLVLVFQRNASDSGDSGGRRSRVDAPRRADCIARLAATAYRDAAAREQGGRQTTGDSPRCQAHVHC